jgi:uncharacterized protein YprB with RNaseH-like and TPR domain
MLKGLELSSVLFLDIETVPQYPDYLSMPDKIRKFWDHKSKFIAKDHSPLKSYKRAGIYAEFGKIICISAGYIHTKNGTYNLRLKSFFGSDEFALLSDFGKAVHDFDQNGNAMLCAHNGKEFDFPYIGRRMIVNGIELPKVLNIQGKKPWEVQHLDTLELWRFGDYKQYTSLDLLCEILEIPTPKDKIDGSMVGDLYWKSNDLESIREYCEKDVLAVVQLLLRYRNQPLLNDAQIEIVN